MINDLSVVVAASSAGAQLPSVDGALRVVDEVPQADGGQEEKTQEEGFHSDHL